MKEIIKKIIPLIIVILAINTAIYTLAAFIMWQPDPAKWDEFIRFLVGFMAAMLTVIAIGAYSEYLNED